MFTSHFHSIGKNDDSFKYFENCFKVFNLIFTIILIYFFFLNIIYLLFLFIIFEYYYIFGLNLNIIHLNIGRHFQFFSIFFNLHIH